MRLSAIACRNSAREASSMFMLRSAALSQIPFQYLLPGPEHDIIMAADVSERVADVGQPVRRAHDVGVQYQRHYAGAVSGVAVKLLELVDGAVAVFARLVMLDQHHRDIVAFLRVRDVDDRSAARLQHDRLVVGHPVAAVIIPLLGQEVWGFPGLGQSGAEPAAWVFPRRLADCGAGLPDILALVG